MSAAAWNLTGAAGLRFLRFALDAWATGHRLHTEEVSCRLVGCGAGSVDPLAHCMLVDLAKQRVIFDVRRMSVSKCLGLALQADKAASAQVDGPRRVVMATLAYHRVRAIWATGGRKRVSARAGEGVGRWAPEFIARVAPHYGPVFGCVSRFHASRVARLGGGQWASGAKAKV